jgi:RNA polymerase sigma-70 factor (ECF subfamily)
MILNTSSHAAPPSPGAAVRASEDARLLEQLRRGDPGAGHRFVQDHYPAIYRYLAHLTGRRDTAEDLTQETFLQAWRHLGAFEGRSTLRSWLYRIAYREFLQSLRRQQNHSSLEELSHLAEPGTDWTEAVWLREMIRKLPVEEREVVVLHYLEGCTADEIARVLGAPLGRIKHRLMAARRHLQQELGEGDLAYLNETSVSMRQWAWLPLDQMHALETRLCLGRCSVFGVRASEPNTEHPIPNTQSEATTEEPMERREFLRQAAAGAAGMMLSETEKEVVDSRLTQKVTCAFKATALSDLCAQLSGDTGIQLAAGPSVADEKVTLFCEKLPLRDVMRQLSRPFGYTWLRSGQAFMRPCVHAFGKDSADLNARTPERLNADYRYELVQDLRSQLLEEELRNRDRNEALLALDREIERYRKFLDLSPDEALARAKTASAEDRPLLECMATNGWGQVQIYFRLTPRQQEALLAGQDLRFSQEPKPGEQPLPVEIGRGVLESQRHRRIFVSDGLFHLSDPKEHPDGMLLSAVPEARAALILRLKQSELGEFTLSGLPGVFISSSSPMRGTFYLFAEGRTLARGRSPSALDPNNAAANARLIRDPALQRRVSVAPGEGHQESAVSGTALSLHSDGAHGPSALSAASGSPSSDARRLTSADVLEALHRATGMPVIADFYTRLYLPEAVTVQEKPLFETLNRLADAMRLRWNRDPGNGGGSAWLQFRSSQFFNDRLKEVPNRWLVRWSAARRRHGMLLLDDLLEIAALPDAQLNGKDMADGAKEIWGLSEWELPVREHLRPHLRFLGGLSPEQRQMALSSTGLPFNRMSLAQQQQFLSFLLHPDAPQLPSQTLLSGCVLRVTYTHPGEFQWSPPDGPWYLPPPVQELTREAALRSARHIDPQATEEQIAPTRLDMTFLYLPADTKELQARIVRCDDNVWTN